jgi:CRISPR associated protein Cas1
MAASKTVSQQPQSHNSNADQLIPRHGVVTLYGYGIKVCVDRGHLLLEDGIGADRRRYRLPRVRHGLKRLVVIGSDGMVSLAALRWLADQDASFVMLERDGSVLPTTGPVRPSDAKLRRAQALAHSSGAALRITRELISQSSLDRNGSLVTSCSIQQLRTQSLNSGRKCRPATTSQRSG